MISGDVSYWIPGERLGVLQSRLEGIPRALSKRKRAAEFNRLARVLHDLNLVSRDLRIMALCYGVAVGGEVGLIISCSSPVKKLENVPERGSQNELG